MEPDKADYMPVHSYRGTCQSVIKHDPRCNRSRDDVLHVNVKQVRIPACLDGQVQLWQLLHALLDLPTDELYQGGCEGMNACIKEHAQWPISM